MIEPRPHLKFVQRAVNDEPSRMFKKRLDRNERNQFFPEDFVERVRRKITGELFMVYPEPDPIYEKTAQWLGILKNQIMLHSGSDQAIKAVFETYIDPGEKILLHFPGYAMYDVYAKMFQAQVIAQHYHSDLAFDWDQYISRIKPGVRMVVVENPNGFLGVMIPLSKLHELVVRAKECNTLVLVDEAYFHFHEDTVLPWIARYDHVIISRTFSKAFGLAGLRAGYLISQERNIEFLKKVRPVYEITAVTALVLNELLNAPEECLSYVRDTRRNREWLCRQLDQLGIPYSHSRANFLAIRLGDPRIHDGLRIALAKQDILIRRPFREEQLKEWVRISTAPPGVQEILISELKKLLQPHGRLV